MVRSFISTRKRSNLVQTLAVRQIAMGSNEDSKPFNATVSIPKVDNYKIVEYTGYATKS